MEQILPLQGLPAAIGLNQRYIAQQSTTLIIKEKLFSWGGDYTVTDVNNNAWFKVNGKVLSLHQKKAITDLQGQEIFTVNTRLVALFKSFFLTSPQGGEIMQVTGNFSSKFPEGPPSPPPTTYNSTHVLTTLQTVGTPKSTIQFTNVTDGQPVKIVIKGNFFDTEAYIRVNDLTIARINRKFVNIIGPQKYTVTVAPGADVAMVMAICICLDERRENDGNAIL
ncbi:MAG: hypothetical protein MMC33_005028 [Icmadophila ericetorum]|nr:hypothetical protein [Icmadophila ericetorum]